MNLLGYCVSCLLVSLGEATTSWTIPTDLENNGFSALTDSFKGIIDRISQLEMSLTELASHTMLLQYSMENRVRTEGQSGVKQVRLQDDGRENYHSHNHIGYTMMADHSHSDFCRVVGMGEVTAVLNGIEFQTRHNDYSIVMKDETSSEFLKTREIPLPDVPPEVLQHGDNVTAQVEEMGEWFKAFKKQNYTVRDYRKYFKPVLCYMEGTWTTDKPEEFTESFASERHFLDAENFQDLFHKARLAAYSGAKSRFENSAFLPASIMYVDKHTRRAVYAQFNYRILCHPLKDDLPVKYLHQMTDLAYLMKTGKSNDAIASARSARYKIWGPEGEDRKTWYYGLIDDLMGQIPGYDNFNKNLTDPFVGESKFTGNSNETHPVVLNESFYSRRYRHQHKGAMGTKHVNRGYADQNLWVAQTTQPRVAPMYVKMRGIRAVDNGPLQCENETSCLYHELRYSYAFPLELLYLTPLFKWNPYNITLHPNLGTSTANGRNGGPSEEKALNGSDCKHFYQTPIEFLNGRKMKGLDTADTGSAVHVLDSKGVVRAVSSSGFRAIMIDAGGAGNLKFRYPIAPIHGEDNSVWKEVNALRDMVFRKDSYDSSTVQYWYRLDESVSSQVDHPHEHEFGVEETVLQELQSLTTAVNVTTSKAMDHVHKLEIRMVRLGERFRLVYTMCDGQTYCWDGHPTRIFPMDDRTYRRMDASEDNMMMMNLAEKK